MLSTGIDHNDRELLSLLQTGFPLTREPYVDLGLKLAITAERVIDHIRNLKAKKIVRLISPVLEARKLGYQSTLVAMKITGNRIERAEQFLTSHEGVSHGYEREHDFNIWITLSLPHKADLQSELQILSSHSGAEAIITLPALKVFKLRTNFGLDEDSPAEADITAGSTLPQMADLSTTDRLIINALQHDLPLTADPFAPLAKGLDMSIDTLLQHCHSLSQRGIIRRYGASINHYNAGYRANALTCWIVPPGQVNSLGHKVASFRQVSHCYERKPAPPWRYNLFAMIHSPSKTGCRQIADKISADSGLSGHAVLFSTKEFKKTRITYRV